jgi:histidinol-phosphate aminotransferase
MSEYDKPAELYEGLRLHQNENTGGCSPRVLEALASLSAEAIAVYPPYRATIEGCARYFGVAPDDLAITNGLDEGILAAAVAYLRPAPDGLVPEAIVPQPAFEIFQFNAELVGARVIRVPPRAAFAFALEEVLDAITPRTRVVFLTNPNNPTGVPVPLEAVRTIADRVPSGAIVFLDETYADFAGTTFIPELGACPNVIVGRTFSKAHGLAGLRIGAVMGSAGALEPMKRAIPVYSVSVAAVAAVNAAMADREHLADYLRQVRESKALLYAACDRLGFRYWPSAANFVLVHTGAFTEPLVEGAARRGIYLRDRSNEPGCSGCVRITTGVLEHTRRCIAVIEEVVCAAR